MIPIIHRHPRIPASGGPCGSSRLLAFFHLNQGRRSVKAAFSLMTILLLIISAAGGQAQPYREAPETGRVTLGEPELFCPRPTAKWRDAQVIEGVKLQASPVCHPDNPYEVAAFVKGTNNVSMATLMQSQISPDAVVMGRDLDGDGDPDEIHIRLEVAELNGFSPDIPPDKAQPVPTYYIAPGVSPGFWVFVPKTRGMSTRSIIDLEANPLLRMPAPVIRVEQGDSVKVTLENTHYFPHTIHLHGVDHPYLKANGEGNDGVPETSEKMVMPGKTHTYEIKPRQPGSFVYHCHVQPHVHIMMGLAGMFIVEENRPDNWVQTLNVGAGQVRAPAKAVSERYDKEYDLIYFDVDRELGNIVQQSNDPRVLARVMHQEYNLTHAMPEYFLLNGRSFPYTVRESIMVVKPDEKLKVRMMNAGDHDIAIHTHGHKMTITHYDGIEPEPPVRIMRDVVSLAPMQRLDLEIQTANDGLHNYGEGIWLFHDHFEHGVTTDGMNPGGGTSSIVYEKFLGEDGLPLTQGLDLTPYFTKEYYQRKVPVWFTTGDPSIIGVLAGEEESAPDVGGARTPPNWLGAGILVLVAVGVLMLSITSNKRKL